MFHIDLKDYQKMDAERKPIQPSFELDTAVLRENPLPESDSRTLFQRSEAELNEGLTDALVVYKYLPSFEVRHGGYIATFDGRKVTLTDENEDTGGGIDIGAIRSEAPATYAEFISAVERKIRELATVEGSILDKIETIETANVHIRQTVSGKTLIISEVQEGRLKIGMDNEFRIPILVLRSVDPEGNEKEVTGLREIASLVSVDELQTLYKTAGKIWGIDFDF